MEKINVAVIGLGNIAQTFHLPVLSKLPEVEISAVCDLDKTKAQVVAKKYGIPRWYDDYRELLDREQAVDGIDNCTNTRSHEEIAIASFEAGKHVLVEKPLGRTAKEAENILTASKKAGKHLMVGMNNRFRPDAMILKSFIQGGEIGKVFYTRAGWFKKLGVANPWLTRKEQSGGGVILDLGIVMFDLAFWMMGYPEVKEVTASTYSQQTREVEDTSVAFIKMKNGSTMTIESSWSFETDEDFFYCDCFGTDGSGSLNPFRILKRMHGNLVNVAPVQQESPLSLYRKSYRNELQHWVNVLRGLHKVISTGEEAVHRMRVVDGLYRSAKTGKAVKLG